MNLSSEVAIFMCMSMILFFSVRAGRLETRDFRESVEVMSSGEALSPPAILVALSCSSLYLLSSASTFSAT